MRIVLERLPEPDRDMVLIKQSFGKRNGWSIVMEDFFWTPEDSSIYDLLKKRDRVTCELTPIEDEHD